MAQQQLHLRGWVDTTENVHSILKSDRFLSELVTRNASIPIIKGDDVSSISGAIQIFCGARYLAHKLPQKNHDYIKSLVIGELMSPVLPTNLCLSTVEANKEFIFVCEYLTKNDTVYNRGKLLAAWITSLQVANANLDENERIPIPRQDAMTLENYQHYLLWLAYTLPKSQYMNALQLIVTSYVGAAKRGTVSDRFLDKITTGIKDDIGEEILLDAEVIHSTYVNFGRYITAENAEQVFDCWLADLPEHALRLRLTLEQTSGSGLTAFLIIGRAVKKYSSFNWGKVDKLTDGEISNYMDALRMVDGNSYYGFNRDLKCVKSTNYSSVAYIAKELLIQLAGEQSLKNYQGWIKKPKSASVITQMINDYIAKYNEDLMTDSISENETTIQHSLVEAVASEENINLFS